MKKIQITYYAIRNKKTKKLVSGTDYHYNPVRQIYANTTRPPLLFDLIDENEDFIRDKMKSRGMNPARFELVKVVVTVPDGTIIANG